MYMIKPIRFDYKNFRDDRQKLNNENIFINIKTKNIEGLEKSINHKEFKRVLEETGLTKLELLNKCSEDDTTNRILSGRISKKSSRQGSLDEKLQLDICGITASKLDLKIIILKKTEYIPTKNGKIINKTEKKIYKDYDCLKSFDGKLEGKNIVGWIFAKIVFGTGGHQDNVFIEADDLCTWIKNFRINNKEIFIILIDTDNEQKFISLKNKYDAINNIKIVNHCEFQEYLINTYPLSSK